MKKFIERDEFVKRLNENVELTNPDEQEWVKDECIRQAHTMPSVNVGEWISVDERLPEESCECLAVGITGVIYLLQYSCRYKAFNANDYDGGDKWKVGDITHWMPLPEPPKGEQE